jgi:hypothetical protein
VVQVQIASCDGKECEENSVFHLFSIFDLAWMVLINNGE